MAQPFKAPNGVYYIRRKVPEALRTALGREYKRSLNTRDPEEAKRLFALEWVQSETSFTLARAQAAGAAVLTHRDMRVLAERWHDSELAKMEASGDFLPWLADGETTTWSQGDREQEYTRLISLREGLDSDPECEVLLAPEAHMYAALRANNIPKPQPNSAEFETLVGLFREQVFKLSDTALARHRGNWDAAKSSIGSEPLSFEGRSLPVAPIKRLREVFEDYAQDRVLTDGNTRGVQRSIDAYRSLVDEFIELAGDLPVSKISRDVVRLYRAEIARLPSMGSGIRKLNTRQKIEKAEAESLPLIEAATIRNKVRAISAVLSYAVRMQLISENPIIAGGIGNAVAKAASKRSGRQARNHYDESELSKIFSSPAFTDPNWTPPRADFGRAWYWIPLLMYYTGARREELAQLAVRDIRLDSAEVDHYLSILNTEGEEDGARGVKNEGSRRSIPLHADLIRRGFLSYVNSLPQDGQLFPKLVPNPSGYYGANFGRRWADYLRNVVGLASPADPAHGFRHTFKTLCRKVGIPEDVNDAITGHAGEGRVSRGYGEMPLSRMSDELKRFPYVPI